LKGGISINISKIFRKNTTLKKYVTPMLIIVILITAAAVFGIRRKTIVVNIDGNQNTVTTYKSNVGEFLESKDISVGHKDKITPSLNSKLKKGETVTIKRAVSVKLNVDNRSLSIKSAEEDISSMLKAEGVELGFEDKVNPSKETKLSEGIEVDVIRVESKMFTKTLPINFKTVVDKKESLPNTHNKTIQEGQNGEREILYSVVYENDKEVSRRVVSETITKKPLDKIVVMGTYPLMPVSRGGNIMPFSKTIDAKATAYWAVRGVGKTYTASGRKAIRNPDGYSTIAVDPKVIPYGTKLFIEKYGFAIAADTGTSIKGNKIDVYFDTLKEARNWGLKSVKVYILK
jgi:uncharacterized protein YabE (DUF348 family)